MVADAHLPSKASEANINGDAENPITPKVEVTQKIRVDGEVNRARCMPQNPVVVGAKTGGCDVYVFDCSKQLEKQKGGDCEPDLRLRGHDMEGYGLS
nr:wd-40 repeat-containing protein msi2 [Quercus suber]